MITFHQFFILGKCNAISVFLNCIIITIIFYFFILLLTIFFFSFTTFIIKVLFFILMCVHTRERGSSPGFVCV